MHIVVFARQNLEVELIQRDRPDDFAFAIPQPLSSPCLSGMDDLRYHRVVTRKRSLLVLLGLCVLSSAVVLGWGWRRGLRMARHDHSSPSGIWARGWVVSNRFGEPRLELVYSSINWNYGLAWLGSTGRARWWLGWGDFPADEPANLHSRVGPDHP